MIILPRQAQDKHREKLRQEMRLLEHRDPNASHTTEWWQAHHPDFILYQCDRKTVARCGNVSRSPFCAILYKNRTVVKTGSGQTWEKWNQRRACRSFGDKNMQLDFSSEAVVQWQLSGSDNSYSVESIARQGYDAIAADNFGCGKRLCLHHLMLNPINLPRQARDKHKDLVEKKRRFLAGSETAGTRVVCFAKGSGCSCTTRPTLGTSPIQRRT
jgi:hypothetical protein